MKNINKSERKSKLSELHRMCPKKLFGKVKWAEKLKIDKSLTYQQQAKVPLDHAASRLVKKKNTWMHGAEIGQITIPNSS